MGSKWFTGGVLAAPPRKNSVRFRFQRHPVPSFSQAPSFRANLRRVRERLESIKHQIRLDTFSFEEEFPDYRLLHRLSGDGEFVSKVLDGVWRPQIGQQIFYQSATPASSPSPRI